MDITVGRSLDLPGRFGSGWTVVGEDPHGGVMLTRPNVDSFQSVTISKKGFDLLEHWKGNDKKQPPVLKFGLNDTVPFSPDFPATILAIDGRSDKESKGRYLVEVKLPNGGSKREWVNAQIVNDLAANRHDVVPDEAKIAPLKSALGLLPEEEKKPGLKGKFETKDKNGKVTAVTKVKDGVAETRDRHGKIIARTIIGKNELTSIGEKRESLGNMVFKQPVGMAQLQAHILTITGKVTVPEAIPTKEEVTTATTITREVTAEAEGAAAEAQMAAVTAPTNQGVTELVQFLRRERSDLPLTRGTEGVPSKSETARPSVGGSGGGGRGEPPLSPLSGGGLGVVAVGSVGRAEGTAEGTAEPTTVETTTTTTTTSKPNLELTGDRQALTEERDQLMAQIQKQNNTIAAATGRLQMLQREPPSAKRDQAIQDANKERKQALEQKLNIQTKLTEVQFFLRGAEEAKPSDETAPTVQTPALARPRPTGGGGVPLRTRKQPTQILKGSNPVRPPQPILPARQAAEPVERGQATPIAGERLLDTTLSDNAESPEVSGSRRPLGRSYAAKQSPAMAVPGEVQAPRTGGEWREEMERTGAIGQELNPEPEQAPTEAPTQSYEEPGAPRPRRTEGTGEPSEEPAEEESEEEADFRRMTELEAQRTAQSNGLPAGLQPGVMGGPPGLGGGGPAPTSDALNKIKWAKRLSVAWPFIVTIAPVLLGIAAVILFVVLMAAMIPGGSSSPTTP